MKNRLKNHRALPQVADVHPVEHVSTWLLGVAALMVVAIGIVAANPVVAGCGALMAGLLVLVRLLADMRSGITSSNWGTWQFNENRVGFRCNICFWTVIMLTWFVLGVFVLFGWVRLPAA